MLAEKYAEDLWLTGEHELLLKRLKQVPEIVLHEHAVLQLYRAAIMMNSGNIHAALADIEAVEKRGDLTDKDRGILETIASSGRKLPHNSTGYAPKFDDLGA
ncbi:MAG: hypothetical protein GX993_06215 [Bacteroidales bacterium]|nr:hypothetical protein [Bacteroidales bacterium]